MACRTIFEDEIDKQNLNNTNLDEEIIIIIKEEVEDNCSQDHSQEKELENLDFPDTNSDTECSTKDESGVHFLSGLGSQLTKTNEIPIELEGNIGRGKLKGKRRIKPKLEMFGTDINEDDDSQDDVFGDENKILRKNKLRKTEQRFTEYEEQPGPPSPSPLLPPPPPVPGHSRQILWDDRAMMYALNYGSDAGSDESGDDEDIRVVMPVMPRVVQAVMDTPLDEEYYRDGEADNAPAEHEARATAERDGVPPTATDQPWRWYDFEWKNFPNPPIPSALRRETFSQINVGPTTPRVDPYEIFIDIWDRPIMEYIASETNKYASQVKDELVANNSLRTKSRIRRWYDTTADELYIYFGLIMAMGVLVKSRLEEYWSVTSNILTTPGFGTHMTIDRFTILSKFLHFNDSKAMCVPNLEGSEARLYKIDPILKHLNKKFPEMYTPSQNIALDESLLMWKGCLEIGQLIPNKAAKRGIKTYEICESQTGYLWRFEVHAHKKSTLPPQQFEVPLDAITPSIVLRMTQGLEYKGYTLWMDNFYNSPCLARRLKSLGIDCVGTLRTDRKFVPQALHDLTKWNMRPGHIAGLTSGDVDVMVWRDANRVATISTYHGNDVQTTRGSTKPTLILDYNIMMGGVDKKDQLLAMYPLERKHTVVWYKKLFRRLLNVSILNSYIIHRQSIPPSLTHRKFRITLINSLLSRHRLLPIPISPATTLNSRYDLRIHHIAEYDVAENGRRPRRKCILCNKRVHTLCVGCNKTICVINCFMLHHK